MTMMALSLCIGLLIDDAIVVRENIVRHVAMGKDHHTAAREGTDEIGLAVMATTFAICAVFVPVAFMGGIIGKFFYPFGITVVVAVLVSLFVSFTLDPMLSASGTTRRAHLKQGAGSSARHRLAARPTPRWTVCTGATNAPSAGPSAAAATGSSCRLFPSGATASTPTARATSTSAAACAGHADAARRGAGIGTLSFVGAIGWRRWWAANSCPQTDQGFTQLNLRMPVGSSLERTNAKVLQVEHLCWPCPR
jgi:multidrug efflux pump subunit AcrB